MYGMAQSALAVANTFIEIAEEHHQKVTPLKLLKLVYFAHGWHLALTGKPLIDEPVEAWKFGPVVCSVYHAFKSYRDKDIEDKESILDMDAPGFDWITPVIEKGDESNLRVFLEKVWDTYGKLGAGQLSNLTHQSDSPWFQVWERENGKGQKGIDIPNDLIKAYFESKIKKPAAANEPATTEQTHGEG